MNLKENLLKHRAVLDKANIVAVTNKGGVYLLDSEAKLSKLEAVIKTNDKLELLVLKNKFQARKVVAKVVAKKEPKKNTKK